MEYNIYLYNIPLPVPERKLSVCLESTYLKCQCDENLNFDEQCIFTLGGG